MAVLLIILHLIGFLSSIRALFTARTSPASIAWIVSLNTFPYVAVPAYWLFGHSKFQGYVTARSNKDTRLANIIRSKYEHAGPFIYQPDISDHTLSAPQNLAKMPFTEANSLSLLIDGDETFQSIFEGIESAQSYILVQFYIVRDDNLGRELKDSLIQKARQGVSVFFLYDALGSHKLPLSYINELLKEGVQINKFSSSRGLLKSFQINFRNHRKIVVADGKHGWVGGLNIGDEYLRGIKRLGPWRDTHLKISGPAVLGLQISFLEDWYWATDEIPELNWIPSAPVDIGSPCLIIPSGPADRFDTASLMIQHMINTARERLWVSSPYFVPDEGVMAALKLAAFRGVDVRVLIPEKPDHMLVYYAAYAFIGSLIDADIKVYRYNQGFLHGKAFLVDDKYCGIGTVNLDNRSFRLNFEITALMKDSSFARELEQMFIGDFLRSRSMNKDDISVKPLWFRTLSRAAYLTAPIL